MRRVNTNGDFDVRQLGDAFVSPGSGQITADMWRIHDTTAGAVRVDKSTSAPSFSDAGRVIRQSMEITVTTTASSIGAAESAAFVYRGEGSEWAHVHGRATRQTLFLNASMPCTLFVGLANGAESLVCASAATIGVADVWTPVTIDLPAAPETGWWMDRRVGYSMFVFLAFGSNHLCTPGTWLSGNPVGDNTQTNFMATANAKLRVAGWDLGLQDDSAPRQLITPEAEELLCMRYIEKSFARSQPPASAIGLVKGEELFYAPRSGAAYQSGEVRRFTVPKRKAPAMTGFNPGVANAQIRNLTLSQDDGAVVFDNVTEYGFRGYCVGSANTGLGNTLGYHWLADASLPSAGSGVFE